LTEGASASQQQQQQQQRRLAGQHAVFEHIVLILDHGHADHSRGQLQGKPEPALRRVQPGRHLHLGRLAERVQHHKLRSIWQSVCPL
jgi:hypothetical protein